MWVPVSEGKEWLGGRAEWERGAQKGEAGHLDSPFSVRPKYWLGAGRLTFTLYFAVEPTG